jgi:hypothetical protein
MFSTSLSFAVVVLLEAAALPTGLSLELESASSGPNYPDLPILLSVSLTNQTDTSIAFPAPTLSCRDNPFNTLDIFVGANGTELKRVECMIPNFAPWKEGLEPELPETMVLNGGESWHRMVVLSHDWRGEKVKSLVSDGEIRIQVALCSLGDQNVPDQVIDRAERITSTPLALTIVPATGRAASARRKLQQTDRPWLVAHPAAVAHVSQDKDFRTYQELARMPGNTSYTQHAQIVVAYMLAQGNALDLHGGRKPQPQVAQRWMQQAMKNKDSVGTHPEWVALEERLQQTLTDEDSNAAGNNEAS